MLAYTVSNAARACSASNSTLDPAASATSLNLSGNSAMMSSVWVPMDPVDPRTENAYTGKMSQQRVECQA